MKRRVFATRRGAETFAVRLSLAVRAAIRSGLKLRSGRTGITGAPGSYAPEGSCVCPLGALRLFEQTPGGYYVESGRLVRDVTHENDFLMGFDGHYNGRGKFFALGRAWKREAATRGWLVRNG